MAGADLFETVRKFKKLEEPVCKFIGAQLVLVLGYLRTQNILHRVLSPENVLIDEKCYIQLTHFRLAKRLQPRERTNSFCGTPDYLAPEIINESSYSFAVDWWALGVLLYEMAVGFPPFYDTNRSRMYERIRNRRVYFPDPARHKIYMSDHFKDFIAKVRKALFAI